MSLEMTHDDVRAALAAGALGALAPDEHAMVASHLAGCAECRAELEAYEEARDALVYAAPAVRMDAARSSAMRSRLMARAAAERAPAASRPGSEPGVIPLVPRPARALAPWLAAAASVVLMVGAGLYALSLQRRVAELGDRLAAAEGRLRQADQQVAERDALIAGLAGPQVRVIDLASTRQQAPSGRMFWNPATDRWTFYAYHLPQVREGREYQLWLITPTGPVGAGTFRPAAGGGAVVQATYDLPPDQLRAVAVTEEPAGGVPQPTGEILILGNAAAE